MIFALVGFVALYCTYKWLDLFRVLNSSVFSLTSEWHGDAAARVQASALAFLGLALAMWWFRRQGILAFLAALGSGALAVGLIHGCGVRLDAFWTWTLLSLPFVLMGVWARNAATRSSTVVVESRYDSILFWILFFLVAAFALDQTLRGLLIKAAPTDDELNYGYVALIEMLPYGFTGFMERFTVVSTPPAWILFSHQWMGWIPASFRSYGMYVIPAMIGTLIFYAALAPVEVRSRRVQILALLALSSVFVQHYWIARMTWYLWYGDAFAALLFGGALIALDPRVRDGSGFARRPAVLFSVGAAVALCKPPYGSLIQPLLALYLVMVWAFFRDPLVRNTLLKRAIAMLLGALASKYLFVWIFVRSGTDSSSHMFQFSDFLSFHWDGSVRKIAGFILGSYKNYLIVFPALLAVSLVFDWRRYLFSVLAAIAGMAVIVLLYATKWHWVEHESAARYFLHSIGGWMIYFFYTQQEAGSPLHGILSRLRFSRVRS